MYGFFQRPKQCMHVYHGLTAGCATTRPGLTCRINNIAARVQTVTDPAYVMGSFEFRLWKVRFPRVLWVRSKAVFLKNSLLFCL